MFWTIVFAIIVAPFVAAFLGVVGAGLVAMFAHYPRTTSVAVVIGFLVAFLISACSNNDVDICERYPWQFGCNQGERLNHNNQNTETDAGVSDAGKGGCVEWLVDGQCW